MLEDTKERALPQHAAQTPEDYLVYLKQVALYDFAARACAHQVVLDLGCGEGYGSRALSRAARFVVAADHASDAVAHAAAKYARDNVAFAVCDAQQLPFRRECFGAVVSFEVIEHVPDVPQYLGEVKRVAAGSALISTPNRLLRLLPFQKPWNNYHRREYDPRGLARALGAVFSHVEISGITARPALLAIEKRRVKQNPLVAYPKMLAHLFLPAFVYNRLRGLKGKLNRQTAAHAANFDVREFSTDDFYISEDGEREWINLLATSQL
jgi:SAM-dependent methyltransferase